MEDNASARFMKLTSLPSESKEPSTITSTILKVLAVAIVLALLGLNIFYYLGDATEFTAYVIEPVAKFFGYSVSETTKEVVKTSASGANVAVDATSGVLKNVINTSAGVVDDTLPETKTRTQSQLNISQQKLNQRPNNNQKVKASNEDDQVLSGSLSNNSSKASGVIGYCYIGEDRGNRSCVPINEQSSCMSGEIFPSRDICINPNLRN